MPNKHATLMLTLLTAFTLSACGGGGGSSHRPSVQAKPTPPVADNTTPKPPVADSTPQKPPVTDSTTPKPPVADNTPQKPPVADSTPPKPPVADNTTPKPPVADSTPQKPPVADNTTPKPPVADNTTPKPPVADNTPAEKPIKTDKQVFEQLGLYSTDQGLKGSDMVRLQLNDKNIQLTLLPNPDHSFIGQPMVQTLRDNKNQLVGYVGYAYVNQLKRRYGEIDGANIVPLYLQDASSELKKRPVGNQNVRYLGTMFYHYHDTPNDPQRATVDATYYGADKTLSMELISEKASHNRWYLYDQNNKYRGKDRVAVDDKGNVSGYLLHDPNGTKERLKYHGHFIGGFYGDNGEILTGKAVGDRAEDKWEGVVGANAKSK